jgi:hypothetical protein
VPPRPTKPTGPRPLPDSLGIGYSDFAIGALPLPDMHLFPMGCLDRGSALSNGALPLPDMFVWQSFGTDVPESRGEGCGTTDGPLNLACEQESFA